MATPVFAQTGPTNPNANSTSGNAQCLAKTNLSSLEQSYTVVTCDNPFNVIVNMGQRLQIQNSNGGSANMLPSASYNNPGTYQYSSGGTTGTIKLQNPPNIGISFQNVHVSFSGSQMSVNGTIVNSNNFPVKNLYVYWHVTDSSGNYISSWQRFGNDGQAYSPQISAQSSGTFSETVCCLPSSGASTATPYIVQAFRDDGTQLMSTYTPTPDTTPPVITPPQNQVVTATSSSGAVVTYSSPTATDNVGVTSGPTCNPVSGSTFPIGTTTVTCTASDAAGNVGRATFTVTINPQPTSSGEVTLLSIDRTSYSSGNLIYFSGTTANNALPNVSLVIFDPNNKFLTLVTGIANASHQFQIIVDTGSSNNPQLFSLQGTYTATAFIASQSNGKSVSFTYSPTNTVPINGNQITMASGAGASASAACVTTNNCYSPNPLNVAPGTEVTWTNTDTVSHTVTSGKVGDDNSGSLFDSGLIKNGASFKFTFATIGTYNYYCTVHPWMIGQVVVSNSISPIPTPTPSTITASTDKSSYNTGDSIVVSGTVNPISSINPKQPVTIQTYNSYSVLVRIDQAIPSPSGQFSVIIPTNGPSWQNSGLYTLKIQYDQSSPSKLTFNFNSVTTPPPTPVPIQSEIDIAQGAGASASAACVTTNNCFAPNPAYVSPGTTVTWKNTDTVSHTVTSGKVSDDNAGSLFDSGLIKFGNTFQYTFSTAGKYDYFCTVHPWMIGQVIVGNGIPPVPVPTPPPTYGNQITMASGAGVSASAACVTTNNCYSPNPLYISPGTEVDWTNTDTVSHTVTSGKTTDDNAGSLFDSGLIKKGFDFKFTFATAGTYNYFCTVHPWMIGQVIVGSGVPPTPVPIPTPTDIKVSTDKTSYFTGDTVTASVVLSGANAGQNIAISFDDPTGSAIISRTVTTDSSGSAVSQFKIPSYAKVGNYQVIVTASVNGHNFNSSSQFSVQQKAPSISIVSVQATDQQGNPVSSFTRGSNGYVKVLVYAQTNTPSLLTVNLFDSQFTALGIGSLKTTLATGQSEIILSFVIPNDATVGTADIYVDTFTDWPSSGGKPLTPESSSTVGIQ